MPAARGRFRSAPRTADLPARQAAAPHLPGNRSPRRPRLRTRRRHRGRRRGRRMRAVAVVGASLAGLATARALRDQGFEGRVSVVGDEAGPPYDRPPLSKEFLLGKAEVADLALLDAEDEAELDIDWRLGTRATALDPARRAVALADGTAITADAVVVATGAAPNRLPGSSGIAGVHVLRSLEDAAALRDALAAGSPRVAVIGGSFIGAEIASACSALGLAATVVEAVGTPLAGVLGDDIARACASLHGDNGVVLLCGRPVSRLRSEAAAGGGERVTGVELADGTVVPADVVVMGIGARPNTSWLAGSGLELDDGVVCDTGLRTALGRVAAVGDVARMRGPGGASARAEHWTSASEQPAVAVANLLAGHTAQEYRRTPYFL